MPGRRLCHPLVSVRLRLNRINRIVFVLCSLAVFAAGAGAQEQPLRGIYIIFDVSGSMWGELPDGTRKIDSAREVLRTLTAADFRGSELALRVFGPSCSGTKLKIPFSDPSTTIGKIRRSVGKLTPKGETPIRRSLLAALKDFDGRRGEIILISDGIETCGRDPSVLVSTWRDRGVTIRPPPGRSRMAPPVRPSRSAGRALGARVELGDPGVGGVREGRETGSGVWDVVSSV